VQERLAAAGLLKGRTVAIDATTLEPTRRCAASCGEIPARATRKFLTRLAAESGIKNADARSAGAPGSAAQKRTSNKDWENPSDPDAKITKMKDGRTHLAHKAEHAVDLDTTALVAVTLHGADVGDTTSLSRPPSRPRNKSRPRTAASSTPAALTEIVADKGYHSNQTMIDLEAVAVRSYIAEPERGRRNWTKTAEAQAPVYGNRRRVRGARGSASCDGAANTWSGPSPHVRHRRTPAHALAGTSEYPEAVARPCRRVQSRFAHAENIRAGTPRALQGRRFDPSSLEIALGTLVDLVWTRVTRLWAISRPLPCVRRSYSTTALAW